MKTKLTHIVIHFLIFICVSIVTRPLLATEPLSVNYTLKDGLPSNEIYKIIQDKKGNLWIATDAGIVCFDGKNFYVYDESKHLKNPVIFELYEDFKGRIWFANYKNEVGFIQNKKVVFIPAKVKVTFKAPSYIKSIFLEKNGTLWLGTIGQGNLYNSEPPYNKCTFILKNKTGIIQIENHYLFFDDLFGFLYGKSKECKFYNYSKGKVFKINNISINNYSFNRISNSFSPNKFKTFLLLNRELYYFKKSQLIKKLKFDNDAICCLEDEHFLYVGLRGDGIKIYDKKNDFKLIKHLFDNYTITGILKDKSQGYWISSLEKGLFYTLNFNSSKIKLKENKFNKVQSIQAIDKNNFFFINSKEQVYSYQNQNISTLPFKGYLKIKLIDNKLYVGSLECTYYEIFSKKQYLFASRWKNINIGFNEIEFHKKNKYYLTHSGIWKYYDKNMDAKAIDKSKIYISKSKIFAFKLDPIKKGFWFSNFEGLHFTDLKGNLSRFDTEFKEIKTRINKIVIDNKHNIWLATRGQGIFKISNKYEVTQFDTKKGLLSNTCKTIELDKYQNLWVGTTKGMSLILKNSNYCSPVFIVNQFVNEEILDIHFSNNTLFVGTDNGLLKFDDLLDNYFNRSTLNLIDFKVKELKDYGNFKLVFKCNYHDPNSFRKWILEYRIPDISKKWKQSNASTIELKNLNYGNHSIEIRALSNAGYSKNTIKKTFSIPPKFYQTWWFFVLSILTVILIFYLFYKLIQSQTKRRERKKQEIQLMLSQMESKALRAQMNPHFIFNAMNSIQNFLLSDQEIEAVTFLGKFARLIRNILESTKSELITIKNEREILETYIELEQLRCSYSFDFEFKIEETISLEASQIPSMIIQPFIENAIIHGLIPLSERKGLLQISFTEDEENYFCTVEDNGVGRKQSQINNEKNRKFHTSMGMGITFDRIEQIQKMYGKTVSIQIEDKTVVENKTPGTKIFITFPKLYTPL